MNKTTDLGDLFAHGIDLKNRRIYFGNLSNEDESEFTWANVEIAIRSIHKMLSDFPKKPIELWVSSEGGSTYDLLRLIDIIEDSTAKIIFVGSGEVCSSGAYLMSACDERILYPNTVVMLHDLQEGSIESSNVDRKINATESDRVQERLYELLKNGSRMPKDFWAEVLHRDLYLTPGECLMLGIADRVMEPKKRGNLRKARNHALKQLPEKKELNKLIRNLYKRVHKGKHHTKLELHIPTEEFDKALEVDETPVDQEYLNKLNNTSGVSLPIISEPEKATPEIPKPTIIE